MTKLSHTLLSHFQNYAKSVWKGIQAFHNNCIPRRSEYYSLGSFSTAKIDSTFTSLPLLIKKHPPSCLIIGPTVIRAWVLIFSGLFIYLEQEEKNRMTRALSNFSYTCLSCLDARLCLSTAVFTRDSHLFSTVPKLMHFWGQSQDSISNSKVKIVIRDAQKRTW